MREINGVRARSSFLKMIQITSVALLASILIGCGNVNDLGPGKYSVTDTGYKSWVGNIYWLDDTHFIFIPTENTGVENTAVIWDIKSNSATFIHGEFKRVCHHNGVIYGADKKLNITHKYLWDKYSSEAIKVDIPEKTDKGWFKGNMCLFSPYENNDKNIAAFPLDQAGRYLLIKRNIGWMNAPILLVTPEGVIKELSITGGNYTTPLYIPFRDMYFMQSKYLLNNKVTRAVNNFDKYGPEGCDDGWWITKEGDDSLACIPMIDGISEDAVYAFPLKGLFVFTSPSGEKGAPLSKSGLYLQGSSQPLLKGLVTDIALSPDGCSIAFRHKADFKHVGLYLYKVKSITFCD